MYLEIGEMYLERNFLKSTLFSEWAHLIFFPTLQVYHRFFWTRMALYSTSLLLLFSNCEAVQFTKKNLRTHNMMQADGAAARAVAHSGLWKGEKGKLVWQSGLLTGKRNKKGQWKQFRCAYQKKFFFERVGLLGNVGWLGKKGVLL